MYAVQMKIKHTSFYQQEFSQMLFVNCRLHQLTCRLNVDLFSGFKLPDGNVKSTEGAWKCWFVTNIVQTIQLYPKRGANMFHFIWPLSIHPCWVGYLLALNTLRWNLFRLTSAVTFLPDFSSIRKNWTPWALPVLPMPALQCTTMGGPSSWPVQGGSITVTISAWEGRDGHMTTCISQSCSAGWWMIIITIVAVVSHFLARINLTSCCKVS